jgi:hypothetical protein
VLLKISQTSSEKVSNHILHRGLQGGYVIFYNMLFTIDISIISHLQLTYFDWM